MDTNNSSGCENPSDSPDAAPWGCEEFLLRARKGLSPASAACEAGLLEGAVRRLMHIGVSNNGMDVDTLFLCGYALDAAAILRQAAGQEA